MMRGPLLLLLSCAVQTVSGAQAPVTAIRGATVITGTDGPAVRDATVLIRGTRIEAVLSADRARIPAGATVVDARGKYLIPGLINTHVHVASQAGTPAIDRALALELAHGVTGLRDASGIGRERELVALRGRIDSAEVLAPRLYVSGSGTPRNVGRYGAVGLADLVGRLRDLGVDGIKLRNLTRAQADTAIIAARAAGLPAYGHTYALEDAQRDYTLPALARGATGVMHVLGIGPGSQHPTRELLAKGWERDWLGLDLNWIDATEAEESRLLHALLDARAWLEPTLTTEAFVVHDDWYRGRPEARFIWWAPTWDSARVGFPAFGGPDLALARQGFERMQGFVRRFQQAGGLVIAGTDDVPWPGAGIHEELRLLVGAGLTPLQALQTATRNAAQALGWLGRTGTIEAGKDADLVLLDGDPLADITNTARIRAVIRGGRLLDRAVLDAMLAAALKRQAR